MPIKFHIEQSAVQIGRFASHPAYHSGKSLQCPNDHSADGCMAGWRITGVKLINMDGKSSISRRNQTNRGRVQNAIKRVAACEVVFHAVLWRSWIPLSTMLIGCALSERAGAVMLPLRFGHAQALPLVLSL